jgi:hypothetical protein
MLKKFLTRLAMSVVLLITFTETTDNLINYFQIPNIFGGVAAIASCMGACFPVLTMLQNRD